MKTLLYSLAIAALVTSPAHASTDAPSAETKRVKITPDMSPDEIRKILRENGVPPDKIEEMIERIQKVKASGGAASGGASTGAASSSGASAGTSPAPAATNGTASKTAAAIQRPAAIDTSRLDSQALESKDPALEADRKAIESLKQEKSLLEARIALAETKRRKELFPATEERSRIEAERAMLSVRETARDADAEMEKAGLERKLSLANADAGAKLAEKTAKIRVLETEARIMKARNEADQTAASTRIAMLKARDEARRAVEAKQEYPLDPLKDGVLSISDRRIPFNGVVTEDLADFVTDRIAFYNNADATKPIFIVIDSSPGGSVMAGYRILNAMKSSKAPVFVVVRQYAASMAALTTTSAVRSFVYPGTIILHHQMSTGFQGNMRGLRESMTFADDLFERIFRPVYTKIGYKDSKTFVEDMYKNFNSGDWLAFGDEAKRMHWVTDTVTQIRETSVRENTPGDEVGRTGGNFFSQGAELKHDENGKAYYRLPALLAPGDAWDLYDPQGVFRSR